MLIAFAREIKSNSKKHDGNRYRYINKTKSVESVLKRSYDYFIFVCNKAKSASYIPYKTKNILGLNDPSKLKGTDDQIIKISVIRDEIKNKIYDFISTYETL